MGISNQIPNSRLAQPGVCTSTTRPASPFEGQVIYETDTNRVLVYDASAWVMIADTDQPPALQLIKTQTIGSAVSSVTVSDVFSSEYDDYQVNISSTTFSATDTTAYFKPGNVGTANYYGGGFYQVYGGTSLTALVHSASSAGIPIGTTTSTSKTTLIFDVTGPFISDWTRAMGRIVASNNYMAHYGGLLATTASYTSMTIAPASGTLTGGTIRVYGYRNTI